MNACQKEGPLPGKKKNACLTSNVCQLKFINLRQVHFPGALQIATIDTLHFLRVRLLRIRGLWFELATPLLVLREKTDQGTVDGKEVTSS